MNIIGLIVTVMGLWLIFTMLAPVPARGIQKGTQLVRKKKKRKSSGRRKSSHVRDLEAEHELLRLKIREQKLATQLKHVRSKLRDNEHGITG